MNRRSFLTAAVTLAASLVLDKTPRLIAPTNEKYVRILDAGNRQLAKAFNFSDSIRYRPMSSESDWEQLIARLRPRAADAQVWDELLPPYGEADIRWALKQCVQYGVKCDQNTIEQIRIRYGISTKKTA